jgi:hypothetical protein
MKSINYRSLLARALVVLGGIGMLVGALDLMEGSAVILPGSGLVALGTYLGQSERRLIAYRVGVFILIAIGVGAVWGLSSVGGFGGNSGRSMWWGVLILPYLIGWSMGIWGPKSPRWMLWLGMVVSLWFLAIAVMIQMHPGPQHRDYLVSIVMAALGVLTIGGCINRLRKRISGQQ